MKKFKKVYLHVGSDKTGSSSIQDFLDKNRNEFLNNKILAYPPSDILLALGAAFHDKPTDYIHLQEQGIKDIDEARTYVSNKLSQFLNWIDKVKSMEKLVLSYEGYIALPDYALERFKQFLLQFSDEVIAIFYLRPPISYTISAISQNVKFGRLGGLPIYNYGDHISKLTKIFSPEHLKVRKFERSSLKDGDVVYDFLHLLNVKSEKNIHENKNDENLSLSNNGIAIGEEIVKIIEESNISNDFPPHVFYHEFGRKLSKIKGEPLTLDELTVQKIKMATQSHLKEIEEKFAINLFENNDKHTRKTKNILSRDIASSIARLLFDEIIEIKNFSGIASTEEFEIHANHSEEINILISIKNLSNSTWFSTPERPINLSYKLYNHDGTEIKGERKRVFLGSVRPHHEKKLKMTTITPEKTGIYKLKPIPVQEGVAWFDEKGFKSKELTVIVK